MRIKKALFTNFGRHRRLELDFKNGLVGIFGANGSGKSTIPNGIYGCITNDWHRFMGDKLDNICDLSDLREESGVHVELEHEGSCIEIYRGLRRPVKHSLIIDGKLITEKSPEIQTELTRRLVNFKLMDEYVFVDQGHMFDFLAQTPGERAAAYQLLCRTTKAEEICAAIEKFLGGPEFTGSSVTHDNSDELRVDLAAKASEIVVVKTAIAALPLLTAAQRDELSHAVEGYHTYQRVDKEITALQRDIVAQSEVDTQMKADMLRQRALLDAINMLVAELRPQATAAQLKLDALTRYSKIASQCEIYRQQLTALHEQLAVLVIPPLSEMDASYDGFVAELSDNSAVLRQNIKIVATFKDGQLKNCPTCGSAVADLSQHLQHIDEETADITACCHTLKSAIDAITAARTLRAAALKVKQTLESDVHRIELSVAALDVAVPAVVEDVQQLQEILNDFESQTAASIKAQSIYYNTGREAAVIEGQLTARQTALQRLTDERARVATTVKLPADFTVAAAEKTLADDAAHRSTHTSLTSQLDMLLRWQTEKQAALSQLEARLVRRKAAINYAGRLSMLRDGVFNRRQLPQAVAQANLQGMEAGINKILEVFGSPFWVESSDDLTFTVHFPGAPARRADRLSGGQKGVLAMAFRPVVGAMFGADIGMMTLDEPTAWMDEGNVAYLSQAMARYAAEVRGRRQVIVITHAQSLRSAFDQVIDLDAA